MNQSESSAPHSPTSVAKLPPSTATRTTRRKTTTKAEPQPSSQLVSRSCRSTSKSLAGDMDQENINKNVAQEMKTSNVKFEANVLKTPAAGSTRKTSAATSCTKKDELVQSVYSTRRSTRLLEKCMADLSLKTKETVDNKPAKNEDTEQKVSAQEKNLTGSEGEVIPGRDLSVSMEQVWENLKNDSDKIAGDLEVIVVMDANTEANKEEMNEVTADKKESENSLVQVDKEEETLQAICEEGPKKNDNDQEIGDLVIYVDVSDIPLLESAITETHNDDNESKNVLAIDRSVDQQETEHAIQENDAEPETKVNQTDSDAGDSKTKQAIQENDSEPEKINNFDEETMVDQTDSDSETEPEENHSGVDSDGTISEADSNQAVVGSDIADEEMTLSGSEGSAATAPNSPPRLEEAKVIKTTLVSPFAVESISTQFPRPSKSTTPLKNSPLKLVNENKENNMEMMMMNVNNNENGESKGEEGKKKKKVTIDEENLKNTSIRQLEKMVKELSIKTSNRTALQVLPGNNKTAE